MIPGLFEPEIRNRNFPRAVVGSCGRLDGDKSARTAGGGPGATERDARSRGQDAFRAPARAVVRGPGFRPCAVRPLSTAPADYEHLRRPRSRTSARHAAS